MTTPTRFATLVSLAAALALFPHGTACAYPPDNPPASSCCGCIDNDGVTVSQIDGPGGGEIHEERDASSGDCIPIKADRNGQFHIRFTIPNTCTGDPTVKLRDAKGEEWVKSGDVVEFALDAHAVESRIHYQILCPGGEVCITGCLDTRDCKSRCEGSGGTCMSGTRGLEGEVSADGAGGGDGEFKAEFGIGNSYHGDNTVGLRFGIDPSEGISLGDLRIASNGGFTKTPDGDNLNIDTGSTFSILSPIKEQGNEIGVLVEIHRKTSPDGTPGNVGHDPNPFRSIEFENIAANKVKATVSNDGHATTTVHEWRYDDGGGSGNPTWTYLYGSGMRKEVIERESLGASTRQERRMIYERHAGDTGEVAATTANLISDVRTEWELFGSQWKKIRETVDPGGDALVTEWNYYLNGEETFPSSYAGALLLRWMRRPDGYEEYHEYGTNIHVLTTPHQGSSGARVVTTTWDPGTKKSVREEVINNLLVSRTETIHNGDTVTRKRYYNETDSLDTVTTVESPGSDFGGRPVKIEHPDGTVTTFSHLRSGGEKTVTRAHGAGDPVHEGTSTVTKYTALGAKSRETTTAVGTGHGIVLDDMEVLDADDYGRPLEVYHLADNAALHGQGNWTRKYTYNCCGTATETDRYGITTTHGYDDLKRRTSSTRLGITTKTIYEGLSVTTRRNSSDISKTVRSLSGATVTRHGPSPQTGALVELSSSQTTYLNPGGASPENLPSGIGKKTKRTVIQVADDGATVPFQATNYYLDGRQHRTWGDLEPPTESGFVATTRGNLIYRIVSRISGSINPADGTGGTRVESRIEHVDLLGRTFRERAPGQSFSGGTVHHYNDQGQLEASIDADGVATLYDYNSVGERVVTAVDLNGNYDPDSPATGAIDYGTDQITRTETKPATRTDGNDVIAVLRTTQKVWQDSDTANPNGIETIVSQTDRTPDGLQSWAWQIGQGPTPTHATATFTHTITDLDPATPENWTTTTTRPDGSGTQVYHAGGKWAWTVNFSLDWSMSHFLWAAASSSQPGYDTLNRLTHVKDSRTGVTETKYVSVISDAVASVTPPGSADRKTSFQYDHRGRRTQVDAPDSPKPDSGTYDNITITEYFPDGRVKAVAGDQTYPVSYTYDYAMRMKTMTTYGTETSVTAWNYSAASGRLLSKRYDSNLDGTAGKGPDYTYTDAGRLETRTWARGRITSYSHTQGRLTGISYFGTDTLWQAYLDLRAEWLALKDDPNATEQEIDEKEAEMIAAYDANAGADDEDTPNLIYTHDALGRVRTVTRGGDLHAEYTYRQSDLQRLAEIQQIDTLNKAVTYTYEDGANGTVAGRPGGFTSADASAVWTYDAAGRLATVEEGDDTFAYGYRYSVNGAGNHEGVAIGGTGGNESLLPFRVEGPRIDVVMEYDPGRNALLSRTNLYDQSAKTLSRFAYVVNAIGQRDAVTPTGDAFDTTTQINWGYNHRGELTTATRPASQEFERAYSYDGIGNRLSATDHNGAATNYFAAAVGNDAGGNALNQYGRIAYPASTPITPVHDADGNLESGPVPGDSGLTEDVPIPADASLVWDGENRLIHAAVNGIVVTYRYDHQSRLITRTEEDEQASSTIHYLYEGWNRIAEYRENSSGHTLERSYLWGMDLSGGMQGAGGVGGLLAVRIEGGEHSGTYYPAYDGNGNISEYVDSKGDEAAHFEYDPFGNLTVLTEQVTGRAAVFTYRFSTKPQDTVTGLYYYGYRYYDPVTGRWPSRDPIGEPGGINWQKSLESMEQTKEALFNALSQTQLFSIEEAHEIANEHSTNKALQQNSWVNFGSGSLPRV